MYLSSTASLWTNDNVSQTKKRNPSMRKTAKIRPYNDNTQMDPDTFYEQSENFQNLQSSTPNTIDETQTLQNEKTSRVNEMLNKLTASNNDGNKLTDFVPLDNPSVTIQRNNMSDSNNYMFGIDSSTDVNTSRNLKSNELLPNSLKQPDNSIGNYSSNDSNSSNLTQYNQSYNSPKLFNNQPYSVPGPSNYSGSGKIDERIMEKMNYMIHLLEEQHNEKTANVTEEFILYLFLGIFVIYVVDSFSRTGKYTR